MNFVYIVGIVLVSLLLMFAVVVGAPVLACAIVPVILVWIGVTAWKSPLRSQLGWLFRGLAWAGGIIILMSLLGGFFLPVLLFAAVFVGVPYLMVKTLSNPVPPPLPTTPTSASTSDQPQL